MDFWTLLLGILFFVAIMALAGLLIWLVLGRGKWGEKGMVGVLDKKAVYKGTGPNPGPTQHPQ